MSDCQADTNIISGISALSTLTNPSQWRWTLHHTNMHRSTTKIGNAVTLSRFPLPEARVGSESVFYCKANELIKEQVNSLPITPDKIAKPSREDRVSSRIMYFTVYVWPGNSELGSEYEPFYQFRDELTIEEGCLFREIKSSCKGHY